MAEMKEMKEMLNQLQKKLAEYEQIAASINESDDLLTEEEIAKIKEFRELIVLQANQLALVEDLIYSSTIWAKSTAELLLTLEKKKIKYKLQRCCKGFSFIFPELPNEPDVAINEGTYGSDEGLFESWHFPDNNGDVTGWLTVEQVIEKVENAKKEKVMN